eukprot:SM000125S26057  [mRNA]  locus=s125:11973:12787:- [translate_table: standard]
MPAPTFSADKELSASSECARRMSRWLPLPAATSDSRLTCSSTRGPPMGRRPPTSVVTSIWPLEICCLPAVSGRLTSAGGAPRGLPNRPEANERVLFRAALGSTFSSPSGIEVLILAAQGSPPGWLSLSAWPRAPPPPDDQHGRTLGRSGEWTPLNALVRTRFTRTVAPGTGLGRSPGGGAPMPPPCSTAARYQHGSKEMRCPVRT